MEEKEVIFADTVGPIHYEISGKGTGDPEWDTIRILSAGP